MFLLKGNEIQSTDKSQCFTLSPYTHAGSKQRYNYSQEFTSLFEMLCGYFREFPTHIKCHFDDGILARHVLTTACTHTAAASDICHQPTSLTGSDTVLNQLAWPRHTLAAIPTHHKSHHTRVHVCVFLTMSRVRSCGRPQVKIIKIIRHMFFPSLAGK